MLSELRSNRLTSTGFRSAHDREAASRNDTFVLAATLRTHSSDHRQGDGAPGRAEKDNRKLPARVEALILEAQQVLANAKTEKRWIAAIAAMREIATCSNCWAD
jgi:hypothetical protein